ncbi:MAG: hypothetical protein ACK4FB_07975 [Brevundimonas sp.]|uniref:hypothetical protein n=1 Tax=Brevundimonas sp. TaxID=1871086 RepID=UPI00391A48AC
MAGIVFSLTVTLIALIAAAVEIERAKRAFSFAWFLVFFAMGSVAGHLVLALWGVA